VGSLAIGHIEGKVVRECSNMSNRMDEKVDGLGGRMDERMERMDDKVDGLSKRMDEKVDGLSKRMDEKVDGLSRKMDDLGRDLRFYAEGTSGRLSYLESKAGIPRGDSLVMSSSATRVSTNGK
jgi:hypothetical protein